MTGSSDDKVDATPRELANDVWREFYERRQGMDALEEKQEFLELVARAIGRCTTSAERPSDAEISAAAALQRDALNEVRGIKTFASGIRPEWEIDDTIAALGQLQRVLSQPARHQVIHAMRLISALALKAKSDVSAIRDKECDCGHDNMVANNGAAGRGSHAPSCPMARPEREGKLPRSSVDG